MQRSGADLEQAANIVLGLIATLAALVVAVILWLEHLARSVLAAVGIGGEVQTALLIVLVLFLAIGAIRLFGRLFIVLILLFVVFLLLHLAIPHHLLLWDPTKGIPT